MIFNSSMDLGMVERVLFYQIGGKHHLRVRSYPLKITCCYRNAVLLETPRTFILMCASRIMRAKPETNGHVAGQFLRLRAVSGDPMESPWACRAGAGVRYA